MNKTERRIARYENAPEDPARFTAEQEDGSDLLTIQFQTMETGGGFTMSGPSLASFVEFLSLVVADAGPWQNESDVPGEEPTTPEEEQTNG